MGKYIWVRTDRYGEVIASDESSEALAKKLGCSGGTIRTGVAKGNQGRPTGFWKIRKNDYEFFLGLSAKERDGWRKAGYVRRKTYNASPSVIGSRYCDRCSARIEGEILSKVEFSRGLWEIQKFRLCQECAVRLQEFLWGG